MFKGNKWLAVGVIVVAVIAVGLYVYRFWGKPLSTDPGDWADFATYLSGTVGVAAVVGTLLAFVKTLGQQQALIDSQNEMLKKQKKQLKFSKQQLEGEEHRRKIELTHNSAVKVFPVLFERFKADLNEYLTVSEDEEIIINEVRSNLKQFNGKLEGYFFRSDELLSIFEKHDPKLVSRVVESIFLSSDRVYFFVASHLKITRDLTEFFYIYMHEDINAISKCHEYMACYHAFLMGSGGKKYAKLGFKYLGLPKCYDGCASYYLAWFKIGELLKDLDA